jgi:Zn-dependent protease with chaperone function
MQAQRPAAGKLNPFALPPETDARFQLLMISALALALVLSEPLRYSLNPDAPTPFESVPLAPDASLPPEEYFPAQIEYGTRLMLASLSALQLPLFLILMTFLLAALIYWDHPRRIRRRKKTIPLSAPSDPRLAQELATLAAQAGLQKLPNVELGQNLAAQDGQAFGVGRQKSLYLDAGLRLQLRKSIENFRAIVRHELAHIVNGDIDRTYFAQSLWSAVLVVTILPLLLSVMYLILSSSYVQFVDGITSSELRKFLFSKLPTFLSLMFQTLGLMILVLLTRAGLLRARELYADWRAGLWGSAPALAAIFQSQSRPTEPGFQPWRLHPAPAERLDTLNKPTRLFDVTFDVPFVSGIFTCVILNGLIPVFLVMLITVAPGLLALNAGFLYYVNLQLGIPVSSISPLANGLIRLLDGVLILLAASPFVILAPLAATTAGLQVQRQALADLAGRRGGLLPYLWLAFPAAWMGLGMVVGLLLSPSAFLAPDSITDGLFGFFWLAAFIFFSWLALVYTRFFSLGLLGSHAGSTPPLRKSRLLSMLVGALFLLVEMPLVLGYFIMAKSPDFDASLSLPLVILITIGMLILMGLTFAVHWIVFSLYRWIRPVRCPSCGERFLENSVVGKQCGRCGETMTPWLYVLR